VPDRVTLEQFKEALGSALDAVLDGVEFDVPIAEYSDIRKLQVLGDLPRVIFCWALKHAPELVLNIDKEIDESPTPGTVTYTERIPHRMEVYIKIASDTQREAGAMRDAILAGLGKAPCVESIPLYYVGHSDEANEFDGGVFQYTFVYSGSIFLTGHSVTGPMVTGAALKIYVAPKMALPEDPEEDDVLDVTTTEEALEEISPA